MMKQDKINTLIYWVSERESIRKAREEDGKYRPWTRDTLLRDYRWCNVRRMDDKVSRWLMQNWYPRLIDEGYEAVTVAALARLVNWPESLAEIRHFDFARGHLHSRAASGAKVFTGAYIVPGVPGRSKVNSVCDTVELISDTGCMKMTMESTWAALMALPGIGSFLAGQIVADVAELPEGAQWPDASEWAPVGPGSARGLNRLLGRPKDRAVTQAEFDVELPKVITLLSQRTPRIFTDRRLVAMDVQGCLCEFDKYERLLFKEGTVRARYDGTASPYPAGFLEAQ